MSTFSQQLVTSEQVDIHAHHIFTKAVRLYLGYHSWDQPRRCEPCSADYQNALHISHLNGFISLSRVSLFLTFILEL